MKNNTNPTPGFLPGEVHGLALVQIPEIRIPQVADKSDGLPGGFHFGPQGFVHVGEFVKRKNRLLDGPTLQGIFHAEIFDPLNA